MSSDDGRRDPATTDGGGRGRVSLDELADLQAGLLTADEETVLRARVAADPGAAQLWEALEQTRLELAELGGDGDDEPIPDDVAARIDAALATEAARSAPAAADVADPAPSRERSEGSVVDLAAARSGSRRNRQGRTAAGGAPAGRRWLGPSVVVGAAAAVVAVVAGVVVHGATAPRPQAGSAPVAPVLTAAELGGQWPSITQSHDLGFLDVPGKLKTCLEKSPLTTFGESDKLLGARPVVVDGKYGVLVAVPTTSFNVAGHPVLLVVLGPQCGVSPGSDIIASTVIPT